MGMAGIEPPFCASASTQRVRPNLTANKPEWKDKTAYTSCPIGSIGSYSKGGPPTTSGRWNRPGVGAYISITIHTDRSFHSIAILAQGIRSERSVEPLS